MIYSKLVCLFAYFCILPAFLFGQSLKGRVTDEKGSPIPYASLYLVELQTGVTTDDNGLFQTTLKKGRYTLEVSSIGYPKEGYRSMWLVMRKNETSCCMNVFTN